MTVAGGPGGPDDPVRGDRSLSEIPDERQLLAHDIRSAVSDIIGGLRLIDQEGLPHAARAQVDRVQSASELLARLVEALLDEGHHDPEDGTEGVLHLRRFLDDELRRWHGAAHGTGTRVTLDRAEDLPEIVSIDLLHLRRVLANLMSNAMHHAGGGMIVLSAELGVDRVLELAVRDDGPGFPEDLLSDPFRPAVRGEGGGSGMGLHIAAAHADVLGGTLTAANRPAGGARVVLTIPERVWSRVAAPSSRLPDLSGRRILVADDSGTNRTLIRGMLNRMGAECETAADGIAALNWMARERFDLALVDVEMPTLGGIEVIRSERLRQAQGIAPPTAMVAMTAYVLRDNRDAIHEAGADGILSKPLGTIEAFGAAILDYIARGPDGSEWAPEAAAPLSAVTLAELLAAAGPEFGGQLLDRLREDLALAEENLQEGVARQDIALIRTQTHILLSLTSAVGALPTQAAARRLIRATEAGNADQLRIVGTMCLARLAALREQLAFAV